MDNNNNSSNGENKLQPTFRIRFTISSNKNNNNCDTNDDNNCNNDNNCDDENSDERECNHQNDNETRNSRILNRNNTSKLKAFQFLQPQNHKSSLIVNLSGLGNNSNNNNQEAQNHLFISPDLNQSTPASPPSSVESTFCLIDPGEILANPLSETGYFDSETTDDNSMMSQGCNFMNSLMSASRRRSSSVTPQAQQAKAAAETANNGRRASSSDDLVAPAPNNPLANKSSSGNHLAVGMSNETICGTDSTQINKPIINNHSSYVQHSAMNMRRPLQIEVNDPEENCMDQWHKQQPIAYGAEHPVSLDDILQIDLDENRLEDERKNLENLVEIWEQKVDELERKRFADDVPRTLIEKVLKQRKELRDLECQLYKIDLEESLDKVFPYGTSQKSCDQQFYPLHDEFGSTDGDDKMITTTTGRSGSHLRPGQENTADILEAIPPASSLQYKQYLSRASTGTDSSEYSQIPNYNLSPHRHPLQNNESNQSHLHVEQQRQRLYQSHIRQQQQQHHRHHHHHNREEQQQRQQQQQQQQQQQVYVQLDSPEVSHRPRSSPIRPNYFKDDFKSAYAIVSQDSSSTASSSSSPH